MKLLQNYKEIKQQMTNKQIIIDENKINPSDWLEPYKPISACEIKDCGHLVYAGNDVYGCRIAEDGLVCDDFNNDDECCMYRQLEYYKEALKAKEQECEGLKKTLIEIKKMLKEICMEECSFDWNKTSKKHCGDCDCRYGQILQKISECEANQ